MKPQVINNQVSMTLHAKLSKFQQFLLKSLSPDQAMLYIASFNRESRSLDRHRIQCYKTDYKSSKTDVIANKKENYYLNLQENMFDTSENHTPSNRGLGDWIGVEIECTIPRSAFPGVRNRSHDCGPDCSNYCQDCNSNSCGYSGENCDNDNSSDSKFREALGSLLESKRIKRCSVKSDGSIEPKSGYFAVELTIVFNRNDREPLKNLCTELNKLGAEVNTTCGLHVHLDQRDLYVKETNTFKTLYLNRRIKNLSACLPLFNTIVPKSRTNNSFCLPGVSSRSRSGSRYYAVNLTALNKYKTIEVRMHSSTTDYTKITNWIDILLLVSRNDDRELPVSINNLAEFCLVYEVPERLISYIEARQLKFGKTIDGTTLQVEEDRTVQDSPLPLETGLIDTVQNAVVNENMYWTTPFVINTANASLTIEAIETVIQSTIRNIA